MLVQETTVRNKNNIELRDGLSSVGMTERRRDSKADCDAGRKLEKKCQRNAKEAKNDQR